MNLIIVAMGSVWCGTSMLAYSAMQILPYSVCAILGTIMMLNLSHRLSLHQNIVTQFFEVCRRPYLRSSHLAFLGI